jgi:hypothetical protein
VGCHPDQADPRIAHRNSSVATKAQGWPWIVFQHVAAMRVTVFMVNDLDFLTIGNYLLRKAQQDWDLKRDYRSAYDSG